MTNEQLVARIQAGEDVAENMNQLYDQVKAFIHIIANRYRYSGMVEDLEQEGYLALYPAIDGYDPDHGVKFLTYAEKWIRKRIQRYLQMNGASVRFSVGRDEEIKRFKRTCEQFKQKYGREATDGQLAYILKLDLEKVQQLRQNAQWCNLVHLDSPIMGFDNQIGTIGDMIPSDENLEDETLDQIEKEQLSAALWECVDNLPETEAVTIRRRYRYEQSLTEIAEDLNMGKKNISRLHRKALRTLYKQKYRYNRYLPECWQAKVYQGCGVGAFNRTWTSSTERAALGI